MRPLTRLLARLPFFVALAAAAGMPVWLALQQTTRSADEARALALTTLELEAVLTLVARASNALQSGAALHALGLESSAEERVGTALRLAAPALARLAALTDVDPAFRTRGDRIEAGVQDLIARAGVLEASREPTAWKALAQDGTFASIRTQLDLLIEEEARIMRARGDTAAHAADRLRSWMQAAVALTLAGLAVLTVLAFRLERRRAAAEAELRALNATLEERVAARVADAARASEALRESEQRYRFLFDQIPLACWVYDLETLQLVAVNAAACKLFGYTHAEMLDLKVLDLMHPDARGAFAREVLAVVREQPVGYARRNVTHRLRRGGALLDVEITAVTIVLAGRRARQVSARDVTQELAAKRALEANEALLRALVDFTPVLVTVSSPDGRYLLVNPEWTRLTGISEKDAVGRLTSEFEQFPKASTAAIDRQVERVADTGMAWTVEHRETAFAGSPLLLLTRFPIRDASGTLIAVGTVGTDVTAIRAAEERARVAAARIEKLSRRLMEVEESERRAIARELHDEVGQAMSALKLNLQTLLRGAPTDRDRERLEDSIDLSEQVIASIRHISSSLRPTALDDLGLVPALQSFLERQAARAGIICTLDTTGYDGALDESARTACFRIVQEAVANALKHARAHCLSVRLRTHAGAVFVEIDDDGVGFDAARAREASAAGRSGGLTSMAERAALAGGGLEIASDASGTRIRARLPVACTVHA